MNDMLYEFKGSIYPSYLKTGNAMQFIEPVARHFCKGTGLDVGCGKWPLPGAIPVELRDGGKAEELPEGEYDFIFSSHCLEHLVDPVAALDHWRTRLKIGGVLLLYLPHPSMQYWRPQNCRRHLHLFWPDDTAQMLRDLGFTGVSHSERDMAWSFCCVGFRHE